MRDSRYIDFISAYCDRWCERCALTERCSAFAARCAIAMCDDPAEALELAVGKPPSDDSGAGLPMPSWLEDLNDAALSTKEMEHLQREEDMRGSRVVSTTIMKTAHAYSTFVPRWLETEYEPMRQRAGALSDQSPTGSLDTRARAIEAAQLVDALEIVSWDHILIAAKLHRALDGRDRRQCGEDFDEDPVQNDANGSAKVALISIDRSAMAWQVIALWSGSQMAARFWEQLSQLKTEVEAEFCDAHRFVRPGFDKGR